MKFSIAFPANGTTKSFDIDDDNKCRIFFERRMGHEVEADALGDQFKGYVFKIAGGFDKDGFSMKQGIFTNGRIRLLLSPGSKCYRAKRKGQRKRRSVRGCIVGPDIKMLSLILVKKGQKQIPGLTDTIAPRRLGPKRASGIRKLYGIEKKKDDKDKALTFAGLIKKQAIRRTFKSKKNPEAPARHKAPKIQRLITDVRLRRKKIAKADKINRWKRTIAATEEYKKLYDQWIKTKSQAAKEAALKNDQPKQVKEQPKKQAQKQPKKQAKKQAKKQTKKQIKKDTKVVKPVEQKKPQKKATEKKVEKPATEDKPKATKTETKKGK